MLHFLFPSTQKSWVLLHNSNDKTLCTYFFEGRTRASREPRVLLNLIMKQQAIRIGIVFPLFFVCFLGNELLFLSFIIKARKRNYFICLSVKNNLLVAIKKVKMP
jgi:hypothetical protein